MNININKNMKRLFIIAVLFLSCAYGYAQWEDFEAWNVVEPEIVKARTDVGDFRQWCEDQACAWQKVVNAEPKNENAWLNLFRASYFYENIGRYKDMIAHSDEKPRTDEVVRRMKVAIPDTYTFFFCAGTHWLSEWGKYDENMLVEAIKHAPKDADVTEIKFLVFKLWGIDSENEYLKDGFRILYEKGYYSDRIMRYGWNLMQSMPKNAVYIAGYWYQFEQIVMMQKLFDERKDITIVPYNIFPFDYGNFPYDDFYEDNILRNNICKKLNIKPFKPNPKGYDKDERKWKTTDFLKYLIAKCDRPFSLSMDLAFQTELDDKCLYNEGLLLRYSEKRYDNIHVALHNIKYVYDFKYLLQPKFVYEHRYIEYNDFTQHVDNMVVYSLWNLSERFRVTGYSEASKQIRDFLKELYDKEKDQEEKYLYVLFKKNIQLDEDTTDIRK